MVHFFCADLLRRFEHQCEVSFIKISSYQGTSSTGNLKELIGLNEQIKGRDVIVVEDIVDTGNTLEGVYEELLSIIQNLFKLQPFFLSQTLTKNQLR